MSPAMAPKKGPARTFIDFLICDLPAQQRVWLGPPRPGQESLRLLQVL